MAHPTKLPKANPSISLDLIRHDIQADEMLAHYEKMEIAYQQGKLVSANNQDCLKRGEAWALWLKALEHAEIVYQHLLKHGSKQALADCCRVMCELYVGVYDLPAAQRMLEQLEAVIPALDEPLDMLYAMLAQGERYALDQLRKTQQTPLL